MLVVGRSFYCRGDDFIFVVLHCTVGFGSAITVTLVPLILRCYFFENIACYVDVKGNAISSLP